MAPKVSRLMTVDASRVRRPQAAGADRNGGCTVGPARLPTAYLASFVMERA